MAEYCTIDHLREVIPQAQIVQLTDDADEGEASEAVLADTLESAQAIVDGYLRTRYASQVPLTTAPNLVKVLTRDVWALQVWQRRGEGGIPESIRDAYDTALSTLRQIADGKVSIGLESSAQAAGIYRGNKTAKDRVFDAHGLRGFR